MGISTDAWRAAIGCFTPSANSKHLPMCRSPTLRLTNLTLPLLAVRLALLCSLISLAGDIEQNPGPSPQNAPLSHSLASNVHSSHIVTHHHSSMFSELSDSDSDTQQHTSDSDQTHAVDSILATSSAQLSDTLLRHRWHRRQRHSPYLPVVNTNTHSLLEQQLSAYSPDLHLNSTTILPISQNVSDTAAHSVSTDSFIAVSSSDCDISSSHHIDDHLQQLP